MKRIVLVFVLLIAGCAVGRVTPDGVQGFAIGHAKLENCTVLDVHTQGLICTRIEGGALSQNFAELLSSLIAAAGAAYGAYLGGL